MKLDASRSYVSAAELSDYDENWPIDPGPPTLWTCTNCGNQTYDVVHEEGDQTICIPCWERFEVNEPRHDEEAP